VRPPKVTCLICEREMVLKYAVARVVHHYPQEMTTDLLLYVCITPDCGNQVVVEAT
jgi:hypothetical protein